MNKPDSTEDIVVRSDDTSILQPARYGFAPEQVQAIKSTVAKDCTDAELVMFLEVCARYELDPFAKQAYAAKMGGGGVSIIVSRDGLLAHAHRQPDFVRMDGDVVRKGDEFQASFENGQRSIKHSYGDEAARGEVVGAWSMVERQGKGQTYFYAPLSEYRKQSPTWKQYPSSMILKVAESYALRKAYSISGIVGEAEVDTRPPTNLTAVNSEPSYGDDPELAKELQEAIQQAQAANPDQWRPAKVAALLHGAGDDGKRREVLAEIREAIGEEVADAEIVE